MTKLTKAQNNGLQELLRRGGVVPSSEWVTGNGRHTKKRMIPPFCAELYAENWSAGKTLKGEIGRVYKKLKTDRPRIKLVVACNQLRSARAAING